MKLLVINKHLKDNFQSKDLTFYFVKKNDDFSDLVKIIDEYKPNKIISIDFGVQTNDEIQNGSVIVAKDTISINSKPISWSIPREDLWIDTSEDLNKSICDILEKLSFEHYVGSGIEIENSFNIEKRPNAKNWLKENIKGIYIDSYSSKLNELISNKAYNFSILRIMNSSFPIYQNKNSFLDKFIGFLKELYFYKISAKKIKKDINERKLIFEISKI